LVEDLAPLLAGGDGSLHARHQRFPSRRLTPRTCSGASSASLDRCRFSLPDMFSRLWRMPARWNRILPEPVTWNRFLAAFFVFILGMRKSSGRSGPADRLDDAGAGREARPGLLGRRGVLPAPGALRAGASVALARARGDRVLDGRQHHDHVAP